MEIPVSMQVASKALFLKLFLECLFNPSIEIFILKKFFYFLKLYLSVSFFFFPDLPGHFAENMSLKKKKKKNRGKCLANSEGLIRLGIIIITFLMEFCAVQIKIYM